MVSNQLLKVKELITQLYELGFAPAQVECIIHGIIGTAKVESLSPGRLNILAKELDNYVWFSRRCQSIS